MELLGPKVHTFWSSARVLPVHHITSSDKQTKSQGRAIPTEQVAAALPKSQLVNLGRVSGWSPKSRRPQSLQAQPPAPFT